MSKSNDFMEKIHQYIINEPGASFEVTMERTQELTPFVLMNTMLSKAMMQLGKFAIGEGRCPPSMQEDLRVAVAEMWPEIKVLPIIDDEEYPIFNSEDFFLVLIGIIQFDMINTIFDASISSAKEVFEGMER